MVSDCLRFYDMQKGDNYADMASVATNFYSWNSTWPGDTCFVCIGTTGPVTTITNGIPVLAEATS
ncbi:hypothetical protein N7474_006908 [Penicillium riverlandense]|uniref:uncharacterized protein n=1 Tax=Penicillium riverlandense TaxID=1903569 RepID=UPI0025493155|nr:uncharacterized protein N7474_006908 [Penicillium riverlandense]KAJ5815131.1 hypothetical protein N7474_006908 [Penicillium riverlandense]